MTSRIIKGIVGGIFFGGLVGAQTLYLTDDVFMTIAWGLCFSVIGFAMAVPYCHKIETNPDPFLTKHEDYHTDLMRNTDYQEAHEEATRLETDSANKGEPE